MEYGECGDERKYDGVKFSNCRKEYPRNGILAELFFLKFGDLDLLILDGVLLRHENGS